MIRTLAALGVGAVLWAAAPSTAPAAASGAAAAQAQHHAAVVVDTGTEVKKVCVAFSEESISGAEALRRAGVDPVFAGYSGKGEAVCKLCGTGCEANDCFCDSRRYWAYHRAGPGGAPYAFSRAGVSTTVVRDGDVEGWKWGGGEAPPPATVGEVCNVPEPPPRSSSSSPPPPAPAGSSTTTSPPPATPSDRPPATAAPAESPGPAGAPDAIATPVAGAGAVAAGPDAAAETALGEVPPPVPDSAGGDGSPAAPEPATADAPTATAPTAAQQPRSSAPAVAAFAALLGGLTLARFRLRRAKRRAS